jgi:hypothetical protein
VLFEEGDGLSKEVGPGRTGNPTMVERLLAFFINKSIIDKILAVRLEEFF